MAALSVWKSAVVPGHALAAKPPAGGFPGEEPPGEDSGGFRLRERRPKPGDPDLLSGVPVGEVDADLLPSVPAAPVLQGRIASRLVEVGCGEEIVDGKRHLLGDLGGGVSRKDGEHGDLDRLRIGSGHGALLSRTGVEWVVSR
jgi:hypothetical protein